MFHVITDEIYGSCDAFPDDVYIDSKKYINEGISNSNQFIQIMDYRMYQNYNLSQVVNMLQCY